MGSSLEKLYPWVPVPLQNLGISMFGLAWRHERLGGCFSRFVEEFERRDRWSTRTMETYVNQQLRATLVRAFHHVPYYRRKWQEAGITQSMLERFTTRDLSKLPTTPKEDLRRAPESFVAQDAARHQKLRRYFSSGSTGTPITAICTADDHRRFIAAREVRSFGWAGASIRFPRAMIGGRLVVPRGISSPPFHRYNCVERQVYFSAYHIAPQHIADYVAAFNRYRPRLLTGYANAYYLLARMMLERGIALDYKPDALVLCSEKLTDSMKTAISRAFRARPYEEYGAVENCLLATECECGSLHVSQDFGVVEILDGEGLPADPGCAGRIVCTGLLNESQMLIRYEIGDVGSWSEEGCPCGRGHLPVLKEIVGRLEDVVVGPDGRELVRFHGIFIGLPEVVEGQVIQNTLRHYTVKLVTQGDLRPDTEDLVQRRFLERLGPVEVSVEKVGEIPRTERGKFRAVISHVRRETCVDARNS